MLRHEGDLCPKVPESKLIKEKVRPVAQKVMIITSGTLIPSIPLALTPAKRRKDAPCRAYKYSVRLKAIRFSEGSPAFGVCASAPDRNAASFSLFRLLTSPSGHKWQYLQSAAFKQLLGFQNQAHGWHVPVPCNVEPLLVWTCRCGAADDATKQSTGGGKGSSISNGDGLVLEEDEASS